MIKRIANIFVALLALFTSVTVSADTRVRVSLTAQDISRAKEIRKNLPDTGEQAGILLTILGCLLILLVFVLWKRRKRKEAKA